MKSTPAMTTRRRFLGASAAALGVPFAMRGNAGQGNIRQLGVQTLAALLNDVRAALPEGLNAANSRMLPVGGQLHYCGAVIWRNLYSLGVSGGHSGSYDDGHYAQDLKTAKWQVLLPPSSAGSPSKAADLHGEWLPGRPAAQHSGNHLVVVGDDIVQAHGYSIGFNASGSRQAHVWSGGAWRRYGTLSGAVPNSVAHCFHDPVRKRIVRIPGPQNSNVVDLVAADNAQSAWSTVALPNSALAPADIYSSVGYHPALDCYVLISPHDFTPRTQVYVMDAGKLASGWTPVRASGTEIANCVWPGMEYVPPMDCFAIVDQLKPDTLYYLHPTGGRTDPWVWTQESFASTFKPALWDNGNYAGPQSRLRWSSMLHALVAVKSPVSPTEIFVPTKLGK